MGICKCVVFQRARDQLFPRPLKSLATEPAATFARWRCFLRDKPSGRGFPGTKPRLLSCCLQGLVRLNQPAQLGYIAERADMAIAAEAPRSVLTNRARSYGRAPSQRGVRHYRRCEAGAPRWRHPVEWSAYGRCVYLRAVFYVCRAVRRSPDYKIPPSHPDRWVASAGRLLQSVFENLPKRLQPPGTGARETASFGPCSSNSSVQPVCQGVCWKPGGGRLRELSGTPTPGRGVGCAEVLRGVGGADGGLRDVQGKPPGAIRGLFARP